MSIAFASPAVVAIGDRTFRYDRPWDGRPLAGRGFVALDTETEVLVDDHAVPRLALASACAGVRAGCLVLPDQLGGFVLAHPAVRWVFHNVAFDLWVIDRHLRDRGEHAARAAWWDACDAGRMSCTMLLDQLVELARRDADPRPRDLAALGREYARMEIVKDDPYRRRYGEILDADWAGVEEGFFAYAIRDAIVTFLVHQKMLLEAHRLAHVHGRGNPDLRADAVGRFGVLTQAVEVRAAVALAEIERAGLHLDLDWLAATEAERRARLEAAFEDLRAPCPELFKTRTDRHTGELVLRRTSSGAPSRSDRALQAQLVRVVAEIGRETGREPAIPRTKKGLSQSTKVWAEYRALHPFLDAWLAYESLAKLCQFFAGLREPVVRPSYRVLVRTGRTGCSGPNLQQIPRDGHFRRGFVPSPGHLLLIVDYSYVELRTLAAVCLQRDGRSVLADVIRAGTDPHCYTASLILGVPLDEFLRWKDDATEAEMNGKRWPLSKHYREARQAAKVVNFGVPGGLSAHSLVGYARHTYGVSMTLEQAEAFRRKLITESYPELDRYLVEDSAAVLARNLGVSAEDLWCALGPEGTRAPAILGGVRRVVRGETLSARSTPYSAGYLDRVWGTLARLCRDPELRSTLEARRGGKALAARLFGSSVMTLTSRVRAGVSYSQCRNTPFQGLAADGAKLALWRLVREGYRVVGFVHDEVLIELPDEGGYVSRPVVGRVLAILRESMASVLVGGIPADCEASLATCWTKDAPPIGPGERLVPWSPGASGSSA